MPLRNLPCVGIWPAVKLSTTLFCLWAPPCVLPAGRRGALLGFFEKMGKWSNVDSLMIFILMAAMQMDFTLPPAPEAGALPLATVSVEVMPTEGITYFFLAVLASLLLTALVFHMHKTVCLPPQHPCARPPREATRAGQGTRKAAVRPGTEAAAPPIPSVALRHRSGERFGIVVSLSLIFAFCATLGACFLPVFRLSKGGLLGVALGGESSDEYSVIESGVQLRHASPSSPDWLMEGCRPVSPLVSLAWLSRPELPSRYRVIYFLVIMVAPLAWYFGCLLAWFVPLSPSSRHAAGFMLNVPPLPQLRPHIPPGPSRRPLRRPVKLGVLLPRCTRGLRGLHDPLNRAGAGSCKLPRRTPPITPSAP